MTGSDPIGGVWIDIESDPADRDELVLAVARRRGTDAAAVAAEFERIAERFDVDAAYVAPGSDGIAGDPGRNEGNEGNEGNARDEEDG